MVEVAAPVVVPEVASEDKECMFVPGGLLMIWVEPPPSDPP